MIDRIQRVRRPYLVIDILEKALELGKLDLDDVRTALTPLQQKTYAKNYLAFSTQTLLLESSMLEGPYYPTIRGRELYHLSRNEETITLCRWLLLSLPYYHLHTELRLASILLATTAQSPNQLVGIWDRIRHRIPWYLEHRLPWIQQQVGWKDSSNIQIDQRRLSRALEDSRFYYEFIDLRSLKYWDKLLRISLGSVLTQVDNLCSLIIEQRARHFVIESRWLKPLELGTLILLMLGQFEHRSLDLNTAPKLLPVLEKLALIGLDLRRNQKVAYLISPVRIVFKEKPQFEHLFNAFQEFTVLENIARSLETNPGWGSPCNEDLGNIDLYSLLKEMQINSPQGLFVYDDLNEGSLDLPDPRLEDWNACALSSQDKASQYIKKDHGFTAQLNQISTLDNNSLAHIPIILTGKQLEQVRSKNLEEALEKTPHLYLLVLLLIDEAQSNLYPILDAGEWKYNRRALLAVLDNLLRSLGFDVWDDWYSHQHERIQEITRSLVDTLQNLGVAHVNHNRLELTQSFQYSLLGENAGIRNQTRFVRQRVRTLLRKNI